MIRPFYTKASTHVIYSHRRAQLQGTLTAIFRGAEYLFVVLALSAFASSLSLVLERIGLVGETGIADSPRQIFFPPIYLISACILLLRPARLRNAALRNKPTLILTFLALISCVWSEAPMLTLKRSVMLGGMTLFALYLASRFNQRELLRLLGWTLGIIAILSVVFAVFMPDRGVASGLHEGAWTGIYREKNGFGRYMALGVLVFVALGTQDRRSWYAWVGAALCALLVVLSRSTTALAAMVGALVMVALVPILRQRGLLLMSFGILTLLLIINSALLVISHLDTVTTALGKNVTFSGRVPLWNALIEKVWEKPLLGSGYNAFWISENGAPSALQFDATGGWEMWQAHNGFLELALELGVLGVFVFIIGYAVAFKRAVQTLRNSSFGAGFWAVAILVFMLISSVGESMLLRYYSLWWVVYLASVFSPVPSPTAPLQSGKRVIPRNINDPVSAVASSNPAVQLTRGRTSPGIGWMMRRRRTQDH